MWSLNHCVFRLGSIGSNVQRDVVRCRRNLPKRLPVVPGSKHLRWECHGIFPAAYWGYGSPAWFFKMSTSKKGPIFKGNFDLPTSNHQFARGILVFSGAFGKHLLYREFGRNWTGMEDRVARNTSRKSKTHYCTPQEKHTPCFSWRCLVFSQFKPHLGNLMANFHRVSPLHDHAHQTRSGRFEIQKALGAGCFGQVWRGTAVQNCMHQR